MTETIAPADGPAPPGRDRDGQPGAGRPDDYDWVFQIRPRSRPAVESQDWFKREEYATFAGEPSREDLTDPPPGYLTPSPDQPYGIGPEQEE